MMPLKYSRVESDDAYEEQELEKSSRNFDEPTIKKRFGYLVLPVIVAISLLISILALANVTTQSNSAGQVHHNALHHYQSTHNDYKSTHDDSKSTHDDYKSTHNDHKPTLDPYYTNCGNTAKEARARGCIFDTISFTWLVPECYDEELIAEFDKLPIVWHFYADAAGTQEVPWDVVERGERALFVPWAHHLWHCAFGWRKMHRAVVAGVPVDSYIGSYPHTKHCSQMMVEENSKHPMEEVNTIMTLKFPYCGAGELQWTAGTNYTA